MSCKVGIMLFEQSDDAPHWGIASTGKGWKTTDPSVPSLRLYQIVRDPCTQRWKTSHVRLSLDDLAPTRILGVLEIESPAKISVEELDSFVKKFSPERDDPEEDFSGLERWSCAPWAIRVLWKLEDQGWIRLPCAVEEIFHYVVEGIEKLRAQRDVPFPVLLL